jgi:glutamyl-tRNA reductase
MNLTGDRIRMVIQRAINAAKAVYTQSSIATKPVSVVSLAHRKLTDLNVNSDSRVLVVGSGKTNTTMLKFLHKRGITNYTIYNRTVENAMKLGEMVNGKILPLTELENHSTPFDLLITCTASADVILNKDLYKKILNGDESEKIVVDLALPNDFDKEITHDHNVKLIAIEDLRSIAQKNLNERAKEIDHCEEIIAQHYDEYISASREREIELAMKEVPRSVKEIKDRAINEVFAKDLEAMDEQTKEVLDKMLSYMEKKYISGPMKMAKDILLDRT